MILPVAGARTDHEAVVAPPPMVPVNRNDREGTVAADREVGHRRYGWQLVEDDLYDVVVTACAVGLGKSELV